MGESSIGANHPLFGRIIHRAKRSAQNVMLPLATSLDIGQQQLNGFIGTTAWG